MINIILCGGSGTRLWPVSRSLLPKQFVKLFNGKSLFQLTVERNSNICEKQIIVSNTEQYFLAIYQLEEDLSLNYDNTSFILEPVGRNTAPAIALACMGLNQDEIVLVTPSDHLIKNIDEYNKVIDIAKGVAEKGFLVTFGILPNYPETGYGYIQAKPENSELGIFNVELFHEKPDFETASKYLEKNSKFNIHNSSLLLWNSGMFMFKSGVYLEELKNYSPDIYNACLMAFENKDVQNSIIKIQYPDMIRIPSNSIDYAVMEKSNIVKVIRSDIGWSDLGSFDSLYNELEKDQDGNTIFSNHVSIDSRSNLIIGEDRLIATIDVEGMIIVDTKDALLVAKKGSAQKVKDVVEILKNRGSDLPVFHRTVHRPWGTYTVLEDKPGYKIKVIVVYPRKKLSLQKHYHRSEHWVVISGTATVTVGDEKKLVRPNESTYISMGQIHRLENEGKIPVILIEAQVGEYTGEDDIVRYDDIYGRENIRN